MKEKHNTEEMKEWFLDLCPEAIEAMRDMIGDPGTPVASRVMLIGMILDRALGKPETSVKVTTNTESFEEAEARLMALVEEIRIEEGMVLLPEDGEGAVISLEAPSGDETDQ